MLPSSSETRSRGTSPAGKLGEVLAAVAMEGYAAAKPPPRDADLLEGLGPGPLLDGLLTDRKQGRAAAFPLLAHRPTPGRRRRRGETCPDGSCGPTPEERGQDRRPEMPTRTGR